MIIKQPIFVKTNFFKYFLKFTVSSFFLNNMSAFLDAFLETYWGDISKTVILKRRIEY